MKVSYKWLREYYPFTYTAEELKEILTQTGLEVESVEKKSGPDRNGLVIGKVLDVKPHPRIEDLHLVLVEIGKERPLQIVCGATNLRKDTWVVVALPNTKLYPPQKDMIMVLPQKIGRELSEGMICAEDEIGMGNNHDGILILEGDFVPGTPLSEIYPPTDDYIFEISLTPNRIDAASHIGICRDIAAVEYTSAQTIQWPMPSIRISSEPPVISIEVRDPEKCPRYYGIEIINCIVNESPEWLKNKLISVGLRPINNIVDVGNFVMYECGHPLHIFDADTIAGNKIIVHSDCHNEDFLALDGKKVKLSKGDLVIADTEKPLCLAGIIGGQNSAIRDETCNIFIESAYFTPAAIRRTAKKYDWHTDAAFRFERGADPDMLEYALARAASLIIELTGGLVAGDIKRYDSFTEPRKRITLSFDYLNRIVGEKIPPGIVEKILRKLDFTLLKVNDKYIVTEAPYYRVDVTRPIDVVEEILRIYGYNRIRMDFSLHFHMPSRTSHQRESKIKQWKQIMVGYGFYEVMNNSLIPSKFATPHSIKLTNPLSQELDTLRETLLHRLLQNVTYNHNRQCHPIKLFEHGRIYRKYNGKIEETEALAFITSGNIFAENWYMPAKSNDFYFHQSVMNVLTELYGLTETQWINKEPEAVLEWRGNCLARSFAPSPDLLQAYDLPLQDVWFTEIYLSHWPEEIKWQHDVNDIPRFPSVRRDLSFVVDATIPFEVIEKNIMQQAGPWCTRITCFDVYKGKNIPAGKISYAFGLTFQRKDKTLTDEEVESIINAIRASLVRDLKAEMR